MNSYVKSLDPFQIEMLNIEHHMEKLTSRKQLLQKAYRETEGKSETVASSLIGVSILVFYLHNWRRTQPQGCK